MSSTSVRTLAIAGLVAALCACTQQVRTSPGTFNLEPARVSALAGVKAVKLENAYPARSLAAVRIGRNTWMLDQQEMTETAIVMLRRALEDQGIATTPQAEKTITLRIINPNANMQMLPFVALIYATLALEARFGDGTSTTVVADNQSPGGAPRAFEGAVLFALNKLAADQKFLDYMKN